MADKLYNLKKLKEIAQGNDGFIQEMVVTFVENVTNEIESIQKLKATENWMAIAEISHKLASNFAYLGSDMLHALAGDIEKSVINDHNFNNVAEKADRMCTEGRLLINELKKDFTITDII